MGKTFSVLFAFLLLLISFSFSQIFTNEPVVGEELQILIEGGGNESVVLVKPDGERIEIYLEEGQAEYKVNMGGRWIIEFNGERKEVYAEGNGSGGKGVEGNEETTNAVFLLAILLLTSVLIVIMVLSAAGAISVAFPFAPRRGVELCKIRESGIVKVKLRVGSRPVKKVKLEDEVGCEWKEDNLKMHAEKLKAFECLEMKYEYSGPVGKVKAHWHEEGEKKTLETGEGRVRHPGKKAEGKKGRKDEKKAEGGGEKKFLRKGGEGGKANIGGKECGKKKFLRKGGKKRKLSREI
ncbi:MAG: hypothetical protein ABIH83_05255 [Candidatus Micrarchaeota archaeon]